MEKSKCEHVCSGNCRRNGCNCDCLGEWHCLECEGTGVITKTEWTDTDTSYEVEIKCSCVDE